jgi:16S rRNA processing protein RimM
MPPSRILVGVIGAPHGVRGELRVKPFTAEPLALKGYGPLESEDGRKVLTLLSARMQGEMVVARFEGILDRDAAALLTNTKLFVPRDRLPEPDADEDEFYQADLIGLRVEDETAAVVGTVAAIVDFGAGDLVEIAREKATSVHLPFTRAFVPVVDIAGGRIVIAPPENWLDDTPNDEPQDDAAS